MESPGIQIDFPVIIVGGGPAGLVLAIELGNKGIPCCLFEQNSTTSTFPKASANGARTLEHYRQLGIVDEIRKLGFLHETAYFTRLTKHELARLRLSGMESLTRDDPTQGSWHTPEMPQRMQQIRVEKFLHSHASTFPNISLNYGWQVTAVEDAGEFAKVTVAQISSGKTRTLNAQYVVGCDGPRGLVRRALGIRYQGEGGVTREFMGGQMISTHFRAPDLYRLAGGAAATMYWTFNRTRRAVLISANGRDEFFMFSQIPAGIQLQDETVREFVRAAVGGDTVVEILASVPWTAGYSLVAERFQTGRILIAGDAAHLFTPTGGFGYNTAIGDVANIAWKLAACIQGWGGPALVSSYEDERMPIALRNTDYAARLSDNIGKITIPSCIEDESVEGLASREALAALCNSHAYLEFDCPGLQLGVHYSKSSVIANPSSPPMDDPNVYIPSSTPGARLPHYWLDQNVSTLDKVKGKFTLFVMEHNIATKGIANAATEHGIPLDIVEINDAAVHRSYGCDLLLVRPDQHIAWRGDSTSALNADLFKKVSGW